MKKIFAGIGVVLTICLAAISCQDDDQTFGDIVAPTNIEIGYEIVGVDAENEYGDGSGTVNFTVTADNASSYKVMYSDGTSASVPSGVFTKQFTKNGVNTYTVTVIAYGTGGSASNTSTEVKVFSDFSDPEALQLLTGGSSKVWYWAAATPGHLGVGPNNDDLASNYQPTYYAATPYEKAGSADSNCLYENELTFMLDGETLTYTLDNGGRTFFNVAYEGVVGGSAGQDMCYDYDTSGERVVTLSPSNSLVAAENTRGTSMTFSDNGFMGYYIGTSTYEILSLESNKMVVRAIPGSDPSLAWYHTFTTNPPDQGEDDTDYTNLVWSDEFDVDGAPNADNWSYNLGTGDSGWGNNEQQYYTDDSDNISVADGVLKITAKAESFMGSNYTSARIVSENKFDFTYGKVEFRAKLPQGAGTWPALWMLGSDYATNTWPGCGEIDVMEHVGNDQNTIHGTLHYPGNSGGNANTGSTTVSDASEAFHVYSVIWSPDSIRFFVDDQEAFHTVANSDALPFNSDFFIIMNVAMGGNFGGDIDPAFTESSMEVDYVRVYQ
ncbi:Glycosyl hydrolases family 16 [Pustulibacterium marinum]|uniref:Glycosyl hydrolases family 16 n=1 Tax=Pustulibacterium marinum TaxID=1224947 RepID=A0A1I7F2L5_9FLAO|nr:glycoside hydrolase family 16 protein [Pustulibacterium marinum]SFU30412.1 Glycosyl hydrolases family 16 [Pustulibacterium marinum]